MIPLIVEEKEPTCVVECTGTAGSNSVVVMYAHQDEDMYVREQVYMAAAEHLVQTTCVQEKKHCTQTVCSINDSKGSMQW